MADAPDTIPPAVDQSGNLTIWWVPALTNEAAPKVTELSATDAKRITYSFTADGWTPTGDQEILTDDRLTLPQGLQSLGKTTAGLTLRYVDSDDASSAAAVLIPGTTGYFIERPNVPNATLATIGQKVYVRKATLGAQIPGPRDGSGKFSITQTTALQNVVGGKVALVA